MSGDPIRKGRDGVLAHTPGCVFPVLPTRLMSLRHVSTHTERGVVITAGFDPDGRFFWLVQASNPATGDLHQAAVFDRRKVQSFVDTFASAIAPATSA
jgi:hypothetical protein